jgi:transglutaminase-like putative cysteine protease
MTYLHITHRTEYQYRKPVTLGPHRLVLRPREARELRLISSSIKMSPPAQLNWAQDVFGNYIATANFIGACEALVIESEAALELTSTEWPIFPVAATAISYPFSYSPDERADLGALLSPQYPDSMGRLSAFAASFVRSNPTDTLSLLKDLNAGITSTASYSARDDEGTQSPSRTLDLGRGSCRDFAVLFAEAARVLGLGARIVSGYFFSSSATHGSTHAWAEVFVPGAGWIAFDPTNRQMGGHNLIPVAVGRDLVNIMPVSGTFVGERGDLLNLAVSVVVAESNQHG